MRSMGWHFSRWSWDCPSNGPALSSLRYVPLLTEERRQKRLRWARTNKRRAISYWRGILFADESTFHTKQTTGGRRVGKPRIASKFGLKHTRQAVRKPVFQCPGNLNPKPCGPQNVQNKLGAPSELFIHVSTVRLKSTSCCCCKDDWLAAIGQPLAECLVVILALARRCLEIQLLLFQIVSLGQMTEELSWLNCQSYAGSSLSGNISGENFNQSISSLSGHLLPLWTLTTLCPYRSESWGKTAILSLPMLFRPSLLRYSSLVKATLSHLQYKWVFWSLCARLVEKPFSAG